MELYDSVKSLDESGLELAQAYATRQYIMAESGLEARDGLAEHYDTSSL